MNEVRDRVRQYVRQHDLARPETRVAAAVSGGSDSMALAHLLAELDRSGQLRLAGLVHFNHQLRTAADDDEEFVRSVAASLGVPFTTGREDVRARAKRERRSLEDAARGARYEAFERAALELDAHVVALGHTRDDQAETVLLRLVRGAGPRGLAGMHPRNGRFVRPLLECRRADLRVWLAERRIAHVEDETNADVDIPRNRVRAELVGFLADRFNPGIVDVLADQAELARELWAWMERASDELLPANRTEHGDARALDVGALRAAPPPLRRYALWRAMTQAAGGRPVSFNHVQAALRLIDGGGVLDSPGQRVERVGGRLVLTSRPPDSVGRWSPGAPNFFRYPLSIPGEVARPASGWVLSVETTSNGGANGPSASVGSGAVAVVRGDLFRGSLAVRNRRPGDRFRPVGLNGWKKLQDLFVDRKVARHERDAVPLVVDGADRIVWVAGFGIDEVFRVTEASQAVLVLRLKQA
jgi:tRNA(Ile)-lysidine synthase